MPARPTKPASYPVSVRQVAVLLHASFRHHLAGMPLRFANPSPPSGWIEDFHFPATEHAGHTTRSRETRAISDRGDKMVRTRLNIGCRYSTPVRERPLHPTRGHFTPEPSQTQAPVTPATEPERRAGGSLTTLRGSRSPLRPYLKATFMLGGLLHYLNVFSMKPSVLAFSISVRTFARSRPDGTSASISSFRVTSLPGRVVSCSTTASMIL